MPVCRVWCTPCNVTAPDISNNPAPGPAALDTPGVGTLDADLSIPYPAWLMVSVFTFTYGTITCTGLKYLPCDPWLSARLRPASSRHSVSQLFYLLPKNAGDWPHSTWAPRTDPTAAAQEPHFRAEQEINIWVFSGLKRLKVVPPS